VLVGNDRAIGVDLDAGRFDWNGDGRQDLAMANSYTNSVSILINNTPR